MTGDINLGPKIKINKHSRPTTNYLFPVNQYPENIFILTFCIAFKTFPHLNQSLTTLQN